MLRCVLETRIARNRFGDPNPLVANTLGRKQVLGTNDASAPVVQGVVRVEPVRAGERVAVTISDNGRGIPPDQLPRIVDPFYTTRTGGNGLGLAVARRIAISHGGEITIRSDGRRGTAATVTLRSSDVAATASPPSRVR